MRRALYGCATAAARWVCIIKLNLIVITPKRSWLACLRRKKKVLAQLYNTCPRTVRNLSAQKEFSSSILSIWGTLDISGLLFFDKNVAEMLRRNKSPECESINQRCCCCCNRNSVRLRRTMLTNIWGKSSC